MPDLKKTIIRTGMESLYFSGAHRMMGRWFGGVGVILTLHHVRPPRAERFQPNQLLEVTPGFLRQVAQQLRQSGMDLVSLDEMHRRLVQSDFSCRFVAVTFDVALLIGVVEYAGLWSLDEPVSLLQRRVFETAFQMLAPGGTVVVGRRLCPVPSRRL